MKVLLWYADLGEGPPQELSLLQEGFRRYSDQIEIAGLDALSFAKPLARRTLQEGYQAFLEWLPGVWGLLQTHEDWVEKVAPLQRFQKFFDFEALRHCFANESPDLLVGLHPLALLPAALLKREGQISVPIVAHIPGFQVHRSWLQPGVSRYVVGHIELEERLRKRQLRSEKIRSPGIPIPPSFFEGATRKEQRNSFGFGASEFVVLLLTDGVEEYELGQLLFQCALMRRPVTWLIDAGESEERAAWLRQKATEVGIRAKMFGKQESLRDFFRVANWVVGRFERQRVTRSFACGTPFCVLPEESKRHEAELAFLAEQGVLWVLDSWELASTQLESLWGTMTSAQTDEACAAFAFPDAMKQIAALWIDLLHRKEEVLQRDHELLEEEVRWLGERAEAQLPGQDPILDPTRLIGAFESQSGKSEVSSSPFEEIGGELWSRGNPRLDGSGHSAPQPRGKDTSSTVRAGVQARLAALLLSEKKMEEEQDATLEQIERWEKRLELAEHASSSELVERAARRLESLRNELSQQRQAWQALQTEKQDCLTQRHTNLSKKTSTSEDSVVEESEASEAFVEKAFRSLEIEKELNRLKEKLHIKQRDLSKLKDEEL